METPTTSTPIMYTQSSYTVICSYIILTSNTELLFNLSVVSLTALTTKTKDLRQLLILVTESLRLNILFVVVWDKVCRPEIASLCFNLTSVCKQMWGWYIKRHEESGSGTPPEEYLVCRSWWLHPSTIHQPTGCVDWNFIILNIYI